MSSACLVSNRFLFILFFKGPNYEVSLSFLGMVFLCLIAPRAMETTGYVYVVICVNKVKITTENLISKIQSISLFLS